MFDKLKELAAKEALKGYCKKIAPDIYKSLISLGCDFMLTDLNTGEVLHGIKETGEIKHTSKIGDHTETTNKIRSESNDNSINIQQVVSKLLVKIDDKFFKIKIFGGERGRNYEFEFEIKKLKIN